MLRYYRGQSLFSLLLSLALSSFLLLVILQFYTDSQKQLHQQRLKIQLQTELQRVLQLISKDLRRAGFRAPSDKVKQDNWFLFEQGKSVAHIFSAQQEKPNSCVLFFYDVDESGCLGEKFKGGKCVHKNRNATTFIERELFGYRLHKGMIETRLTYKTAVNAYCQFEQCQTYLQQQACYGGGWADLLDKQHYGISQLQFNWLAEHKGIEVKLAGYLVKFPHIRYETSAIVPLLNQESLSE